MGVMASLRKLGRLDLSGRRGGGVGGGHRKRGRRRRSLSQRDAGRAVLSYGTYYRRRKGRRR